MSDLAIARAASAPPIHAHGAMIASAPTCDQIAPKGRARRDMSAPAAMIAATAAACVAGRRPAMRAVSHPAISAETAPQATLTILKGVDAASCGSWPDNWNSRTADVAKTM